MTSFHDSLTSYQARIEIELPIYFPLQPEEKGGKVVEAARYSLLGGGKRIRPALMLAATEMLGGSADMAMPYACALEMIHTYSLIHDDLPCMDDDDLRRGRPTCHKVYGEAMAVLAGDALLNRAFEVMLAAVDIRRPGSLEAVRMIARSAGSHGMIGGQALDIQAEGHRLSPDELKTLHQMKTGALLAAPLLAAAAVCDAAPALRTSLGQFADAIGLAFQIQDDILDATADSRTLGKSTGKDLRDSKPTYVSLFGLTGAGDCLKDAILAAREALADLRRAGCDTGFLEGLASYLQVRTA